MIEVGAYHAKTHLPKLLDRVSLGERITVTRHGVPVAVLGPVEGQTARPVRETIEALRAFRSGRTLGGLSIRAMREEGRA